MPHLKAAQNPENLVPIDASAALTPENPHSIPGRPKTLFAAPCGTSCFQTGKRLGDHVRGNVEDLVVGVFRGFAEEVGDLVATDFG
jgi:hypothetical protein